MPKYTSICDISFALDYHNSIKMNSKLLLKDLVKKTVMSQTLFTITVDNIVTEQNKIVFLPNKTFQHGNSHRPLEPLIYINISKILFKREVVYKCSVILVRYVREFC